MFHNSTFKLRVQRLLCEAFQCGKKKKKKEKRKLQKPLSPFPTAKSSMPKSFCPRHQLRQLYSEQDSVSQHCAGKVGRLSDPVYLPFKTLMRFGITGSSPCFHPGQESHTTTPRNTTLVNLITLYSKEINKRNKTHQRCFELPFH